MTPRKPNPMPPAARGRKRWAGTTKARRKRSLRAVRAARKWNNKRTQPLSRAQVAAILRLRGRMPQRAIAAAYGVTQAYISVLFKRAGVKYGVYVREDVEAKGK